MSNMSYCRFQNTLHDLRDCQQHCGDSDDELGFEEKRARENLIELCKEIADDYGEDADED
jgi:hypothetical protein